jgi:transposase
MEEIVVLMSAQGQTVKDITSLMQVGEDYVRDVIHAFKERVRGTGPKGSEGRPRTISEQTREHICLIARASPADWGLTGFATWSLSKLADHLVQRRVVPKMSRENLRRILRSGKALAGHDHLGRLLPIRTSSPRCTGFWPCTTPRRPTGG